MPLKSNWFEGYKLAKEILKQSEQVQDIIKEEAQRCPEYDFINASQDLRKEQTKFRIQLDV